MRWQVFVTLQTGAARRVGGTADTEKQARAEVRAALDAAEKGVLVERSRLTLGEHLTAWLAGRASIRERTRDQYDYLIKTHITPGIGSVRLTGLNTARLRQFYADLAAAGAGDSVRRQVHNVLHAALKMAHADGRIPGNSTASVRPEYAGNGPQELKAFTPGEAEKFYTVARADRWGVVLAFMLITGLRKGETLALTWDAVNLDAGTGADGQPFGEVAVRATRSQSGARIYENAPKTDRGRRVITIEGPALDLLREVRAQHEHERALRFKRWQDTTYVFTTRHDPARHAVPAGQHGPPHGPDV